MILTGVSDRIGVCQPWDQQCRWRYKGKGKCQERPSAMWQTWCSCWLFQNGTSLPQQLWESDIMAKSRSLFKVGPRFLLAMSWPSQRCKSLSWTCSSQKEPSDFDLCSSWCSQDSSWSPWLISFAKRNPFWQKIYWRIQHLHLILAKQSVNAYF